VIKHGVHDSTESIKLEFECLVEGSFLEIRVRNNFRVSKEETLNTGTGLESVRKRLYMIYNRPDLMEIIKKDGTFEVKIRIPVKGE
jgi:LytS/YehU family sensor histidine kinase